MTIKRIGFACKFSRLDPKTGVESVPELNTRTTTVAWLKRQSRAVAEERLWDLMKHNIESVRKTVEHLGTLDHELRMYRISSDLLPVYTEPNYRYFWQLPDVKSYAERHFAVVGSLARNLDVRLSFHPGQFCCIVSDSSDVVDRSIEELEYHSDMVRWMNFGSKKLEFKINIHLSGRLGVSGFEHAWNRMSPELRNCLTLENDEYQQGLDNLLVLRNKVGIVLDIHHHLIKEHEYIQSGDERIQKVLESWQGIRPTIHYSQSREEYIGNFLDKIPTMEEMLIENKKAKLRSHSDFFPNKKINEWALTHLEWSDIMVEAKSKNLASLELFNQWRGHI